MINKDNLKIAIVGCGALTRIFYLPVFKRLSVNPVVLVDPDLTSINDLAKSSGAKKISNSLEDIADDIDAAIIATPNFLHFPQTKILLEKGKHVLLEKPIASKEALVKELINVEKSSGVILQPAMMRRFWKINKAVKTLLQEEIFGILQSVSMQEGGVLNWPVQSTAIFNPALSLGGVLMDTGSHTLDLLCWWVENRDFELEYEDDSHGGVEADCRLSVNFMNTSVKAEVKLSRIRNMSNEFILTGTKGWIKLKPWGNVFEASDRRIEKYIYRQYTREELKKQSFIDLFTEQVKNWLFAIEHGSAPVIDAESVLPSIRMIEQGYQHRRQLKYAWN